ncbi:unnamed protein product [Lampetra planeri]
MKGDKWREMLRNGDKYGGTDGGLMEVWMRLREGMREVMEETRQRAPLCGGGGEGRRFTPHTDVVELISIRSILTSQWPSRRSSNLWLVREKALQRIVD